MNNREIKFRVWDTKHKKWYSQGVAVNLDGKVYDLCSEGPDDNLIVQQYTGIKDEYGMEVYDGDIVNWTEYQGWEDGRTIEGHYEVKWNEEALRLDFYDPYENSWWELADTKFNQVVGNVFENGELLK